MSGQWQPTVELRSIVKAVPWPGISTFPFFTPAIRAFFLLSFWQHGSRDASYDSGQCGERCRLTASSSLIGGPHVNASVSPVKLLASARAGDRDALDRLLPLVYDELKRVARNRMRREAAGHTLQATALVHEAYLKLIDQHSTDWDQRAQFFAIASEAMRRVLVNHAVALQTDKRGGKWSPVTVGVLDSLSTGTGTDEALVIELDRALTELAVLDSRQARVVELRYFGGLTIEETAAALDLSVATVKREWSTARLWLKRALEATGNDR